MYCMFTVVICIPAEYEAGRIVELLVSLVPPEVLPSILDSGQCQHDTNGNERHLRLERVHHRDEIQDGQAHEVNVGHTVELLE